MIWSRKEETAALRDRLAGALIGLSRATYGNEHLVTESTCQGILAGLLTAGERRDAAALSAAIDRADEEKRALVPMCYLCASPCGRTSNYDMDLLWDAEEPIRTLKLQILSGLCDLAAHTHGDGARVYREDPVRELLFRALFVVGEDWEADELQPVVQELTAAVSAPA